MPAPRPARLRRRDLIKGLRAHLEHVTEQSWFYNLDNHRDDAQVARELKALASTRPATIDLVETTGNKLPAGDPGPAPHGLDDYVLVRNRSNVRRAERGNIAAYVRRDLYTGGARWLDARRTWARPKVGGRHPARSFLVYPLGRMQRLVAHQAARNVEDWQGIQGEGYDLLADAMTPRQGATRGARLVEQLRPRVLVQDGNGVAGDPGPAPDKFAKRIGGKLYGGKRIDHVIARGRVKITDVETVSNVAGVALKSDHRHAVRYTWRVRRVWLARPGAGKAEQA